MLNQSVDAARVFGALGDPTRRAIVDRLSRRPATMSELAGPLAISLPAVFQHVAVLEGAGIVRTAKVGRARTCRLEPAALAVAEDWLRARRSVWEDRLDRLGDYLAANPEDPE